MVELDLVIFDLAGTTVEDTGQVASAFTAALGEHGLQATPDQLSAVRGASKRQAVLDLVPDGPNRIGRANAVYASFRDRLAAGYAAGGAHAMPGAEAAFQVCAEMGNKVALNTGFDRDTTGLLLAALGWEPGRFSAVVCGDEVPAGRPAPYLIFHAMETAGVADVHRVMVVGDTRLDLLAGYHAGARWNVGVLSGAHDRQTLEQAPHTHLLASVADLPVLLRTG